MLMKPIKRGYKVSALADSGTSYVLIITFYEVESGKSVSSINILGERVVLNVTEKLRNSGSLVAFGYFFHLSE